MACLPPGIDWGAKDVEFVCKYSYGWERILMVPDPTNVPDWKEPTTRWYPAIFIKRHNRAVPHDEYKFRWFECTDGIIYDSESSILQPSMLRSFTQSRKFCEEIAEVDLTAEQIIFSILVGEVRMPFYMLPDHPDHQNPLFKEIFGAAIQQVAKILMDFDLSHPVVANFAEHFKSVKAAERRRRVPDWMRTIGLTPTPELEAVISPPLTSLLGHSLLSHIPLSERQERVLINFEYFLDSYDRRPSYMPAACKYSRMEDGKTVNLNESTWFKAVSKRGEAFRYIGLKRIWGIQNEEAVWTSAGIRAWMGLKTEWEQMKTKGVRTYGEMAQPRRHFVKERLTKNGDCQTRLISGPQNGSSVHTIAVWSSFLPAHPGV
ncbi:hypothetical protein DFH08DRAFT_796951 [Mycena albidolilacea]|uniref:Uncharacterized protein n=1 Tax=Mycena albidolilacea TaxID=1033008 RepID=A0AAD7F595_9AGAR|nr:hypothetical protein DFH08DRAFT_796951 [Mycena albidolilacea]